MLTNRKLKKYLPCWTLNPCSSGGLEDSRFQPVFNMRNYLPVLYWPCIHFQRRIQFDLLDCVFRFNSHEGAVLEAFWLLRGKGKVKSNPLFRRRRGQGAGGFVFRQIKDGWSFRKPVGQRFSGSDYLTPNLTTLLPLFTKLLSRAMAEGIEPPTSGVTNALVVRRI